MGQHSKRVSVTVPTFAAILGIAAMISTSSAQEKGAEQNLEQLVQLLRKAKRNEVYFVDAVSDRCHRITSGLRQRSVLLFTAGEDSETSTLRADGRGQFQYAIKGDVLGRECRVVGGFGFSIRSYEPGIWSADVTSKYCKEYRVFDDCSSVCNEYWATDGSPVYFANGLVSANKTVAEHSLTASCSE